MSKAGYKRTIQLQFDYDSVKQAVPDVNRALAELNADFAAQSALANRAGKEIDKVGLSYDKARTAMELHGKKVELLKDKLSALENAETKNEKAISRARIELAKAEKDYNNAARTVDKLNAELHKQNVVLGKSASEWASIGERSTALGQSLMTRVTLPILALGAGSVKLASDMQETMGKVDSVFDKNAGVMRAWAETSLEKMGMAKQTALDMASIFGDLALGMGLNSHKTLEYSKTLTQLTADYASFKNKKAEVVQTALQGIFTGETEALKGLGVVMAQANLQQFAYSQGIQKRIQDMSQAELVQLRYNFVLEKSSRVMGDFERTGGGVANQARKFQESLKELGATFGEQILPLATPLLEMLNGLLKMFIELPAPVQRIILVVAGLAAAIAPILIAVGMFANAIVSVNTAITAVPKIFATVSGAVTSFTSILSSGVFVTFLKWAAIIAGVTLAVWLLVEAINYLFRGTSATAQTLDKVSNISRGFQQGRHRAYAVGTHFSSGGRARLHEYGDEIVDLPGGSRVYTAEQSKRLMANGSSGRTDSLLETLISRVDRLTTKVERLPDRQVLLARE